MKRSPQLEPLSDDHHNALVLARRCRHAAESAASEASVAELWHELRRRFAAELEPHFAVEERLLLPALTDAGESALAERTRGEHARLRALVASAPAAERAAAFGKLLHDHVRFEERTLFPRAEAVLPAPLLEAVGRAALAARGGG